MFTAVTNNIRISVETQYSADQSNPDLDSHIFSYKIIIENHSEYTVQLHRRFWEIKSLLLPKRIVEGPGIVGLTPVIEPGKSHTYISYCPIESNFGKMSGYYTFEKIIDGTFFHAYVPAFSLVYPPYLN